MWLREVVFQGVFGVTRPARIRVEAGLARLKLPPGIDPQPFLHLVLALLYPASAPQDTLRHLADASGEDLRIGLVLEAQGRRSSTYKIFRRLDADSILVKDVTDPDAEAQIARGAHDTEELLTQRLGLPPYADFALLHAWTLLPQALQRVSLASAPTQDAEVGRLISLHRAAVELEDLQQRADELRADQRDLERDLGRYGASASPQRAAAQPPRADLEALRALSDDDRAFLKNLDTQRADLAEKATHLDLELESAQRADANAPLWREVGLWAPLAVALIVYIVSAVTGLRAVALLNIILLGVSASTLLRRFGRIERADQRELRLGQLRRRAAATQEEGAALERRLNTLLQRTQSRDLLQLRERLSDLERIHPDEESHAAEEPDPALQAHIQTLRAKLDNLQREQERIKQRQSAIDDPGMPSYELEQELLDRGFDLLALQRAEGTAPTQLAADESADPLTPFRAAAALANARGLFVMGRMIEKAASTFNKLATHLAGPTWEGVTLTPTGDLFAPNADLPARLTERPAEARLLLLALLSAIYASTAEGHPLASCRLLLLPDPTRDLPEKAAAHLNKMLHSLASRANVVVLSPDGAPAP